MHASTVITLSNKFILADFFLPNSGKAKHGTLFEILRSTYLINRNFCVIVCLTCVFRHGQMLSVRGEKVSESLFLGALKKAVTQWPGARLIDYSCVESGILGNVCLL